MSTEHPMPGVLERHELKYTIPYSYLDSITEFLLIYCDLDYFSRQSPDFFYRVNSLYFDTRSFEFLRQRLDGKNGRFNMRARCYLDGRGDQYYLEIKRKQGVTGVKYRATVSDEEWPGILIDPGYRVGPSASDQEKTNKERFMRVAHSYAIEPKLLTQYERRAFTSSVDHYARVTLDRRMRYRKQSDYELIDDHAMVNYDNETIYGNQGESVIMELKCNVGQVPTWMLDLVALFNLKQQGFSKYANSALVSHFDDGESYMSGDRMCRFH